MKDKIKFKNVVAALSICCIGTMMILVVIYALFKIK